MPPPFTKILRDMPPMTPFVGPETLERRRGEPFRYRLGANESAFGMSRKARDALAAEVDRASWYCDPEHWEIREKLATNLGVKPEHLVIGEGIDGLLGLIVRAFAEPGDAIVTSAGAYPTFNYHVLGYGARLEFVPYRADSWNDAEALAARAQATGAKLIYLANPDNPTGTFLGHGTIEHLIEAMPANCLLVLDEAYAEFAPPGDLVAMTPDDPRLIRLRTFSKAHGMAGLRIGYAIAATETVEAFDRIRLHFGVGRLSQIAAAASLDDPEFAASVVAEVAHGRAEYEALGVSLGVRTLPSLTNFVPFEFADGDQSDRIVALLDARGVFVRKPGVAPLDRFIRVTVGTAQEREGFADAFRDAVRRLRG